MSCDYIDYQTVDDGTIAIISIAHPAESQVQSRGLIDELHDALRRAELDDDLRVVVLQGNGLSFSAGHHLGSTDRQHFFERARRWRDLRKITIASVQGKVLSADLLLAWAWDLIVAAEGTTFADDAGSPPEMSGTQYFAHLWEFGPRKLKELLLTGGPINADEACRLGMVNKVLPLERLDRGTLDLARRMAKLPTVAAMAIKASINRAQDEQKSSKVPAASFPLHQPIQSDWRNVGNGTAPVPHPDTSTNVDVDRLAAIEEIRQLKYRYCLICDDGHDPEQIIELFTEDAVWETTGAGRRHVGRDAIHRAFASFQATITFSQHNVTNGTIDVQGDLATGTWNFMGVLGVEGRPPRCLLMRYVEKYRRENGAWKISYLRSVHRGEFDLMNFSS
jgi:enoyl-CoA hydratase